MPPSSIQTKQSGDFSKVNLPTVGLMILSISKGTFNTSSGSCHALKQSCAGASISLSCLFIYPNHSIIYAKINNKSLQYSGLESCWKDPLPEQIGVVPHDAGRVLNSMLGLWKFLLCRQLYHDHYAIMFFDRNRSEFCGGFSFGFL